LDVWNCWTEAHYALEKDDIRGELFPKTTEYLTKTKAILRQDVGWFDQKAHATGRLAAHLASEASLVEALVGTNLLDFFTDYAQERGSD
jgi:hypothetical protein